MVWILGHRGASARAQENTIDAFVEARALGADGVELDVRLSADGALVVCHDQALPGLGPVASIAASDLPAFVPLLDSALDACAGMIVNIELKDLPGEAGYDPEHRLARAVATLVAEGDDFDRVIVSSFDLLAIDAAKAAEPRLTTGWLTMGGYDQAQALATVMEHGHAGLHPRHEAVTPELVAAAHSQGIRVVTWTVDEPDRVRRVAAAGVDAVITNVPDVARGALVA